MKESIIREESSFGVIPFIRTKEAYMFLVVRSAKNKHWGFPKGRIETNETPLEVAKRELKEEVGIDECLIMNSPIFSEEYFFNDRETPCHKIIKYFLGSVESTNVVLQEEEIVEYKWSTYQEALSLLSFPETVEILRKANRYLNK